MGEKGYSLEKHYRVYDDTTGCFIKVGPDRDSLDLIEIIQMDGPPDAIKEHAAITMTKEQAILLIGALKGLTTI